MAARLPGGGKEWFIHLDVIFLTGTTGTEKEAVLEALQAYALQQGMVRPGEVEIFSIEAELRDALRTDLETFFDIFSAREQQGLWAEAAEQVLARLRDRRALPRFAIITFHYNLFDRSRVFSPVAWKPLREIARLAERFIFVTLQEDSYVMWARVNRRPNAPQLRLRECITWQSIESSATRLCAQELVPESYNPRDPKHFLISVNHSPASLARLAFDRSARRAYLCFPITAARDRPHEVAPEDVNAFRYRVQDDYNVVAFDPLGIDEEILNRKLAQLQGAGLPDGEVIIAPGERWPIPEERRLLQEAVLRRMGRTPVSYPITIPREQVEEAQMSAHWEIAPRDLGWIDMAECVIAYRPYWGGTTHGGVFTELIYSMTTGRRIFAYDPPHDAGPDKSPFAGRVRRVADEQAFFEAFRAFSTVNAAH